MNGLYFCPHCVGFLFNKKKMSDYYGEYLFSSPTGAYLISIKKMVQDDTHIDTFSSPTGAYLISINA